MANQNATVKKTSAPVKKVEHSTPKKSTPVSAPKAGKK